MLLVCLSKRLLPALLLSFLCTSLNQVYAQNPDKVDPAKIRSILSENCFQCHGPDAKKRAADLRFDTKEGAFADLGGHKAIVPGNVKQSELITRVTTTDADLKMPPEESGKKLTKEEIALLTRWIQEGALWQDHWSYVTPKKPATPVVKQPAWVQTPIDQFILARIEKAGLKPSTEADRRTLIRRVTFDLTGLPPKPQDLEAFVNDKSPNAYEKVVDRLLESPHYGEHMARYWLDIARYGDTHGLHLDNYREMWPYRDWVIKAFNLNLPYDQFVIEQLAGDLLPNATMDQQIATGFNRCHVTTNEGGSIAEEVYVRNVIDRVETTGQAFMGLTLGCAVCHDHKFDPFTKTEFYQMFAFFNNLDGPAMDGNIKDSPPSLRVPNAQQSKKLKAFKDQIAAISKQGQNRIKVNEPAFQAWLNWKQQIQKTGSNPNLSIPQPDGLLASYALDEKEGTTAVNQIYAKKNGVVKGKPHWVAGKFGNGFQFAPGSYLDLGKTGQFNKATPFSFAIWVKTNGRTSGPIVSSLNKNSRERGYDLQITNRSLSVRLIDRWPGYAIQVQTKNNEITPNQWHHVCVTYDGSAKAHGVSLYIDGKSSELTISSDSFKNTTPLNSATLLLGHSSANKHLTNGFVDDFKIYNHELSETEVNQVFFDKQIAPVLQLAAEKRSPQQTELLRQYYLNQFDSEYRKLLAKKIQVKAQEQRLVQSLPTTLVFRERKEIREAFNLKRGQYDQKGEKVSRKTPAQFPAMAAEWPVNRLGLAKWLVAPNHPLTSRVAVNRFWQQLFGIGIVETSEDFGNQGAAPSHPELLDWLAVDFQTHHWDVKRFMKQILMSATYRQNSKVTPALHKIDPKNRLLARGPRFRLDAEMLRDQALAVSGLMVPKIGGSSVKPPQPDGLWHAVGYSGSNTVRFKQDKGPEKVFRRSLYTFWKRTSPPPGMSTFDAPSREACTMRRERTNTPLQALLLLNDPQYLEAARTLGQRMMKEGGKSPEERIRFAYRLATAKEITPEDLTLTLNTFKDMLAHYQAAPKAATELIAIGESKADANLNPQELAAWTMIANLILNLDEVLTKS
ncbi:DUF1553 domain-containing protein [Gimesia aquarii]|uniref:Planctomycete cytochrome C n=1 Tax=Gimesia aquarii TaxID=2527964 RepID=A0A517W0W8_9PLAN|nr:DUF1553 domain-containing protein [Gimesia aquarii]QDT98897.1 Planctomycete cytochrome C [Gimesia aquarii]